MHVVTSPANRRAQFQLGRGRGGNLKKTEGYRALAPYSSCDSELARVSTIWNRDECGNVVGKPKPFSH